MTKSTGIDTDANALQAIEPLKQAAEALKIELNDGQLDMFRTFFNELVDWNSRVNLTGITEWQDVLLKHFADSLSVALAIPDELKRNGFFIDIGTGAGFPGIPLLIAFPEMRGTLLDSTGKKTTFLKHIIELLELRNVDVITDRAETAAGDPEHRERYDIVLGRGLARMSAFAELTLPFARVGGMVIAQKLSNAEPEIAAASNAIREMGGTLKEVIPVALKGLENRTLVVVEKTSATPERYPRRPGIPSKRPL